jgi:exosome complex exonuclease DIS3/RRP44
MLRSKAFAVKTRRGVATVAREHYLRTDVVCGFAGCAKCSRLLATGQGNAESDAVVQLAPGNLLIPDTNVVLHQVRHENHVVGS